MKSTLPKIIVIVGPTASGKSDLGIQIAKKFHGEIISADSRQVYRGMDIGTGKVLRDQQKGSKTFRFSLYPFRSSGVVHHLLDVASPKSQFSVDRYVKLARKALMDVRRRSVVPIIVGGTGLYIDSLLGRMPIPEVPPNLKLRKKLEKQSAEQLFKMLSTLDLRRSTTIDRHNKRRLIRALEIVLTTGKPVPKLVKSKKGKVKSHSMLWIGINPEKDMLAKRIGKRLDQRFKQGMIREVQKLHASRVSWKRLESFGLEYRHIAKYLQFEQKVSKTFRFSLFAFRYKEMRQQLLRDIIRYSKRQTTWFKRNQEIHWITSTSSVRVKHQALRLAQEFIAD